MTRSGRGRPKATVRAFAPAVVLTALAAGAAQGGTGEDAPVPPYPAGLVETSGFCVGDPDSDDTCSHSIAFLGSRGQPPTSIVAQRFHDRVGQRARWRVTDELPYPHLRRDEQLVVGICERAGHLDPKLMAIVADGGDVEWYTDVRMAWRLDGESGRFIRQPTSGIRCMNEGWGL